MSLEELVGTLKVHVHELQQDERSERNKSLALNSQRTSRSYRLERKPPEACPKLSKLKTAILKNPRKNLMKMNSPSFHERFAKCGKTKGDPNGRTPQKEYSRIRKINTSFIVCYGCKKLGHFKSECPELEKSLDKKKKEKKKVL